MPFTIPIGLLMGGFMVDNLCEPFMSGRNGLWSFLFGSGKGSGAALAMFILGVAGVAICLAFGHKLSKYHYSD